jgi:glycosyltransferase involved in cell wall biosynthesis
MHCLIFERNVEGHRLHHVRHLAESLLELGCDVTLGLQYDARERPEYQVHLKALEPHVRFQGGPQLTQTTLLSGRRTVADLRDTIQSLRPDWVYITFSDYLSQSAALQRVFVGSSLFGGTPIEGHINRGTYAYPYPTLSHAVRSEVSRWLMLHNPWRVTHILDPWAYDALKDRPATTEFRLIPEPVEPLPVVSRDEARQTLGIPLDGRYVAIIGGLVPGKGIEELLSAFHQAKLEPDERVLLLGKMSQPIRQLIADRCNELVQQRRLVYVDRYVSDFELDCGFIAADIIAVTHRRLIGSSGTLVRAAAAGTPLLTCDYGWAGWATGTFDLGATVDVGDGRAFAAALEQAFRDCAGYRRSEKGDRFCQYHTLANQKAHWVTEIGRVKQIPLGRLATRIGWDWVLEACRSPINTPANAAFR